MMSKDITKIIVPHELKKYNQWLVWKSEAVKDGKLTKPPYSIYTGRMCNSTDSKSWCSFDEALQAVETEKYDGLGFAVTKSDPFVFLDLDNCRDSKTGEIEEWAKIVVNQIDSYTEISPSGGGLHIIAKGNVELPGGDGKKVNDQFQIQTHGGYLTMTGNCIKNPPVEINKRQTQLEDLVKNYFVSVSNVEKPSYTENTVEDKDNSKIQKALIMLRDASSEKGERSEKVYSAVKMMQEAGLSQEQVYDQISTITMIEAKYPKEKYLRDDIERIYKKTANGIESSPQDTRFPSNNDDYRIMEQVMAARKSFQDWVTAGESTAAKAIVDGLLYTGSLILIHGPSKSGKSTFVSYLINHITWGSLHLTLNLGDIGGSFTFDNREVLGKKLIRQPQRVDIVTEEHSSMWAERLCYANWANINVLPSHLVKQWSAQGQIASALKTYEYLPDNKKPHLIIMDPLTKLLAIEDENNSSEIEKKFGPFEEFTHRTGISVLFIHHPRKSGGNHGEEIRGSSAIAANPDYIISFDRTRGERRPNHRTLKFIGRYAGLPRIPLGIFWDEELNDYSLDDALPGSTEDKILHVLSQENKSLSLKEIEKLTGLSDKTIRVNLRTLCDNKKVVKEEFSEGRGSPTNKYALSPDITYDEEID